MQHRPHTRYRPSPRRTASRSTSATLVGVAGATLAVVLAPATALVVAATLAAAATVFAVGYAYVRVVVLLAGVSLRLRERLFRPDRASDLLARATTTLPGGASDRDPAE